MYHCFVGTDTAEIGIWDCNDSDKSNVYRYSTGGDGEASVHLYIDEPFSDDDRYREVSTGSVEIHSEEMVLDGVEQFDSGEYENRFTLHKGTYDITLFELTDPEREESSSFYREHPHSFHIMEKLIFIPLIALIAGIVLLILKQWFNGISLLVLFGVYMKILDGVQQKRDRENPIIPRVDVIVPALKIVMRKK